MLQSVSFPSGEVKLFFWTSLEEVLNFYDVSNVVFITNKHIARLYPTYFENKKTIVLPAGEHTKDLQTIGTIAEKLLQYEVTRQSILIGVGGGVITDITGFIASVYMRGIKFGFVPTTLLGMVDSSIGGKTGVNLGLNKNILGTFCHPDFILFDSEFLKTIPAGEWSNGFAEIIKYAFIFDSNIYADLSTNYLSYYKEDYSELTKLIEKCAKLKIDTVIADEKEKSSRKLLNFGHTVGHAIENLYEIPHGNAISIGMIVACMISEHITGLDNAVTKKLIDLLKQYYLPIEQIINVENVMNILKMDKKRNKNDIDFILLEKIGKASVHTIPFNIIENTLSKYAINCQSQ